MAAASDLIRHGGRIFATLRAAAACAPLTEPLPSVSAGSVEDRQDMGIGGNLAVDLDQVVVHRRRVADMFSAAAMPTDGLTASKK
jgi:hypothetical protein